MTKNIYIKKDKKEEVVKDINYIFVTFCVPTFKKSFGSEKYCVFEMYHPTLDEDINELKYI